MLNCTFLAFFERSLISTLWTDYSLIKLQSYRTFERSKFKFKTCRFLAKHCPFACPELFERSLELTLWYSVSHKVEISERFKGHKLEFKGQTSNLKHVEKIDD